MRRFVFIEGKRRLNSGGESDALRSGHVNADKISFIEVVGIDDKWAVLATIADAEMSVYWLADKDQYMWSTEAEAKAVMKVIVDRLESTR